jgi:hypothetical protein
MIAAIIEGCQLLAALIIIALALSMVDRRRYVRRLHRMRQASIQ